MDQPLKIGLISPYDHAFLGGVTDHINNLAAEFRSSGHTVRIVAPCSAPQRIADEDFIPMGRPVSVPSGGSVARVSFSIWLRWRIKAMLEREAFDIVHLHEPMAGFVTLNVLSLAKSMSEVLIGTFHTYRGTRLYQIGGVKIGKPYFDRLDGRIAVSQPAHQFISRHFPASYEIIPNGINVDDFVTAEPLPELDDGKINLLFLGRLEKRKGLRYLLSAYSKLKWDWPNLRLIVVGPGKPDDESYRIIGERGLQDVVFVGRVSAEEKARYYKSAHIYCSPATGGESFGIVLLEAMAAGSPVVASDIAGYSSVLTNGHDGLLVEPKKDDQLATAIAELLKDPALRARLAVNGRRTVEVFRWERVAGRVMDYYNNFLESRQAAISR